MLVFFHVGAQLLLQFEQLFFQFVDLGLFWLELFPYFGCSETQYMFWFFQLVDFKLVLVEFDLFFFDELVFAIELFFHAGYSITSFV